METISAVDEIKRIVKGYRPTSNAWYYHVFYDFCTLIAVIKMQICDVFRKRPGYKCPKCGKESSDVSVIFKCISDHEYGDGKNGVNTEKV